MVGLGGLIPHYIEDMNALICEVFNSEAELDEKIEEALSKYGKNKKSFEYIQSIRKIKDKLCATYTQYIFSLGHTTTQRGEGWNACFKGQGELKTFLSVLICSPCMSDWINLQGIRTSSL